MLRYYRTQLITTGMLVSLVESKQKSKAKRDLSWLVARRKFHKSLPNFYLERDTWAWYYAPTFRHEIK